MHVVVPETKACVSCAKLKRKCGKEQPRCHRCESRDLECHYPPARPSSFVPLHDDAGSDWGRPARPDGAAGSRNANAHSNTTNKANIASINGFNIHNPLSPAPALADPTTTTATKNLDLWNPSVVLGPMPDFSFLLSSPPCSTPSPASLSLQLDSSVHKELQIVPAPFPSPPSPFVPQLSTCNWFLGPEAWEFPDNVNIINPREPASCTSTPNPFSTPHMQVIPPYARSILKPYLRSLLDDLACWVTTGGTTFIHKQLYAFDMPRCIQDAQGALALYLARCPATEDTVFRTLDDRASQLLADEAKHNTSSSLDAFGHLARVQALLTYQHIGLLDGDIYLRAVAEERVKVLETWVNLMLESVQFAAALCGHNRSSSGGDGNQRGRKNDCNNINDTPGKKHTSSSSSNNADNTSSNLCAIVGALGLGIKDLYTPEQTAAFPDQAQEELVWRAWIFTESLRRTSIIAGALPAVYEALKHGWTECPKGMRVTATQGMWDAGSRYAWTQAAMGGGSRNGKSKTGGVWFLDARETDMLFQFARPEDVDIFTTHAMEVCFGMERMEKWRMEKGGVST